VRETDPVSKRMLRGALQAYVDRQPEAVRRTAVQRPDREWAAEGVDHEPRSRQATAQDRVIGRLDARLADDLAGAVAAKAPLVQLHRADLAGEP
jgi:hypothetical protein